MDNHDTDEQSIHYPIFTDPQHYLKLREKKGIYRFWKRWFEWRSLQLCLKGINDITSVCDCPCGPGRLFEFWKKKQYKITGVDLSTQMTAAAENELVRINKIGKVRYFDAFRLSEMSNQNADLVACVRFIYYFDKKSRIRLLHSLCRASRKYVLVQYKVSETLRGKKREKNKHAKNAKHFIDYNQIMNELDQADLHCLRIVPKGNSSDRVYVLAQKKETRLSQYNNTPKPFIYNPIVLYIKTVAALLLLTASACFFSAESVRDPHEDAVNQLVREYQDGDDVFYVNADSDFEDLKKSQQLLVIDKLATSMNTIVQKNTTKDCYFIIPSHDFILIKEKVANWGLHYVKSINVGDDHLEILTSEKHTSFNKKT